MTVTQKLEKAVCRCFSVSIYANGRDDYYGFTVSSFDSMLSSLELVVRFKSGERYCCAEAGCHLGFWDECWWQRFRNALNCEGIGDLSPLTIDRVTVIVETGAMLGLRDPNDSSALCPETEWSYALGPFSEANPVRL